MCINVADQSGLVRQLKAITIQSKNLYRILILSTKTSLPWQHASSRSVEINFLKFLKVWNNFKLLDLRHLNE